MLSGKKTYLVALATILSAVASALAETITWPEALALIVPAVLGITIRNGVATETAKKAAGVLLLCVTLAATSCAGLTPAAGSPATAGAPATAGQLAQTVTGQQGQAPSTATGGTAAVNWYFASNVPSEIVGPILKMADEQRWTAEQVAAAIKSANGAPTNVTITTTGNSASGGNASSIPAGTGGAAGVGGAGTVQKP